MCFEYIECGDSLVSGNIPRDLDLSNIRIVFHRTLKAVDANRTVRKYHLDTSMHEIQL